MGKMSRQKNTRENIWKRINIMDNGCWNWLGGLSNRYGEIKINRKTRLVHRVAYELTHGSIINGLFVLHKCNNPTCCNPLHLYLGTQKDNQFQMVEENRSAKGEQHGNVKLNEKSVLKIRRLYSDGGYSQRILAKMFGISQAQIQRIIKRYSWKHI